MANHELCILSGGIVAEKEENSNAIGRNRPGDSENQVSKTGICLC